MATLRSVLGKFNGTMADVTFSNWKGQNVAKQKVPDNNGSSSPAQVAQRTKFAALARISGYAGPVIRIGMKMAAVTSTEQNVFQSLNAQFISLDKDGNAVIDWESLAFSQGKLVNINQMSSTRHPGTATVDLEWVDNSDGIDALGTDRVVALAIGKLNGVAQYSLAEVPRSAKKLTLSTSGMAFIAAGDIIVYYFVKRANTTECSGTYYVPVS